MPTKKMKIVKKLRKKKFKKSKFRNIPFETYQSKQPKGIGIVIYKKKTKKKDIKKTFKRKNLKKSFFSKLTDPKIPIKESEPMPTKKMKIVKKTFQKKTLKKKVSKDSF